MSCRKALGRDKDTADCVQTPNSPKSRPNSIKSQAAGAKGAAIRCDPAMEIESKRLPDNSLDAATPDPLVRERVEAMVQDRAAE